MNNHVNQKGFVNIALIVLVVILVGVAGYFALNNRSATPTPTPPIDEQPTSPPSTTPTPSPTSPPDRSATPNPSPTPVSQLTCGDLTKPTQVQYNTDDPRDYLKPFFDALENAKKETIKCFFNDPDLYIAGSVLGVIDLDKDFSVFSFYINSWTPNNIITTFASDPEFNQRKVVFYMKKIDGQWKILGVDDLTSVLK